MEEKDWTYYLTDLSRVQELTPEELQAWMTKYPYSQNLHLLHAKKQFLQEGAFSEGDVIYATQRSHFFRQVEEHNWDTFDVEPDIPIQPQRYATKAPLMTGAEDYNLPTETDTDTESAKDERPVESTLAIPEITEQEAPEVTAPLSEEVSEEVVEPMTETFVEEPLIPAVIETMKTAAEEIPANTPAPDQKPPTVSLESTQNVVPEAKTRPAKENKSIPVVPNGNGISPFSQWLHELRRPFEELPLPTDEDRIDGDIPLTAELPYEPKVPPAPLPEVLPSETEGTVPVPNDPVETIVEASSESIPEDLDLRNQYLSIARNSNEMKDHIGSETLAKLLFQQGFRDLAVQMYERLALKYPEKSSYFADQIRIIRENQ